MEATRVGQLFLLFVIFATVYSAWTDLGSYPANGAGKRFWADSTQARTWDESVTFCKEVGPAFVLTTGLSNDEVRHLGGKYNKDTFTGTHWIAAVSAKPPASMAWSSSQDTSVGDLGYDWKELVVEPLCGAFYADETPYFRQLNCTLKYKTICHEPVT
ncbi:unnamed protein product [Orchesella dallaii]|uniref:C-type lectin domain-containing protein n=1 Tax=Orchesella dallaii TaxID=48710 RepID=A0ABP1S105_9HEXA